MLTKCESPLLEKKRKMTEIVTGLLINKGEQYYTDLKEVLSLMGDSCKDYNWLITNYACYPLSANNRELFCDKKGL